jgi:peptide methionine sulfoxide reductase msrA/msrB
MMNKVIFAGGCFWCVEHDLREAPGVLSVTSGYTGGTTPHPTYESHGDHREAVLVEYNPSITSFKKLTQFFLEHIDPTDDNGQFADRGSSYRSAIFYNTEEEKTIAINVLKELNDSHVYEKPTAVEVFKGGQFYTAEEYHQNYAEKNPLHYQAYRKGSGREDFINRTCAIREEKHIVWQD